MADLIERLMGLNTDGRSKLPVHQTCSMMRLWKQGRVTGAQATATFALNAAEQTEAQNIVNAVPTSVGNLAAYVLHARAMTKIEDVLILAEQRRAPFDTPVAVRTELGIPA